MVSRTVVSADCSLFTCKDNAIISGQTPLRSFEVSALKLKFQSVDIYLSIGQQCETAAKMKAARCALFCACIHHLQEQVLKLKSVLQFREKGDFQRSKDHSSIALLASLSTEGLNLFFLSLCMVFS